MKVKLPFAILLLFFISACGTAASDGGQKQSADNGDVSAKDISKERARKQKKQGKADFSVDPCEWNNWYSDGECDWFCPKSDPACRLGSTPSGQPTRFPIVLAHGFMAGPDLIEFYKVADALREDGHVVKEGNVPPFSPVEDRAEHLARQVDEVLERTGVSRVNIIAHSMGGLDARYLITSMDYDDRVASLTTISTPHRGTRVADIALDLVDSDYKEEAINWLAEMVGTKAKDLIEKPDMKGALQDLAVKNISSFNRNNLNIARVDYESYAGVSNLFHISNPKDIVACDGKWLGHEGRKDPMDPLLFTSAKIISEAGFMEFKPNDGLVTVESAKRGDFQGCIPADHADEVGQFHDDGLNEETGFDHIRFYRNLAYDLAEQGH